MIKAIETEYNGYRFRSRLEARWAVFFDALGIEYEYEKEGYDLGELGWYLPDFWLPKLEMFIEIKGQEPTEEEKEKIYKFGKESEHEAHILTNLPDNGLIMIHADVHASIKDQERFKNAENGYTDNSPDGWGKNICCPVCGYSYVSYGKISPPMAWKGRGDAIKISMEGECGHSWSLLIGFHKGETYYDFVDLDGVVTVSADLGTSFSKDVNKIIRAAKIAKSARFEHGEKPRVCRIEPINEFPEYTKPAHMDVYTWNTLMNSILGYEIDDLHGNDLDQIRALNRELFKRLEKAER